MTKKKYVINAIILCVRARLSLSLSLYLSLSVSLSPSLSSLPPSFLPQFVCQIDDETVYKPPKIKGKEQVTTEGGRQILFLRKNFRRFFLTNDKNTKTRP
jgi:hypothetical protein